MLVGGIWATRRLFVTTSLEHRKSLEQLQEQGWLLEELLADSAYGSDANVQLAAAAAGVDLISPTCGRAPQASADEMTLDDFAHHEKTGAVEACPQSHEPLSVTREEVVSKTASGDVIRRPAEKNLPVGRTPRPSVKPLTDEAFVLRLVQTHLPLA